MHVEINKDTVVNKDYDLGIKYCPGIEVNLPKYVYKEYKPRYSGKPCTIFGVYTNGDIILKQEKCREPGGVGGQDVGGRYSYSYSCSSQAGRSEEELEPGEGRKEEVGSLQPLISAWESRMEEGGGTGQMLALPGGKEEGRGRRMRKEFRELRERRKVWLWSLE